MWLWLFVASAVLNLFSLLYVRWLLSSLAVINTDIENVTVLIQDFSSHLLQINEMEMFYGDQTLQALMDHARSFREYMEEFDFIYIPEDEEEDAETQQIEEV